MQFVQLVSWLLEQGGQKVSGWNKYDDPTTASQNMILELKKMGIELDMPASKLKAGHGEGVCTLIQRLATVIMQNKFKFKKPVIKDEGGRGDMDDDGDDNDDMEGNADIADMLQGGNQSDDDIEDFAEFGGGGDKAGGDADQL
jgi:Intra-flagellar transport protein 57